MDLDGSLLGGPERSDAYVQSFERGLAVIRAFDADHIELTLSDVARATGLTRATARRLLLTLVRLGYVRMTDRYFSLRPRVLELGYAYLSGLSLVEVARPHIAALAARVDESCSVSVIDGYDVVYVARVSAQRIMSVNIAVGTRFPAYPTSMGRVLLAGLTPRKLEEYLARVQPQQLTPRTITDVDALCREINAVRTQGYALVDEELELGLRSVAAPVRDANGSTLAAVNLSFQASRAALPVAANALLGPLLETAAQISADMANVSKSP